MKIGGKMNTNPIEQFRKESLERTNSYQSNKSLIQTSRKFHEEINKVSYAYNFF